MDLGLDGRLALVTAASKGPGLASALALAADGAGVAGGRHGRALRPARRGGGAHATERLLVRGAPPAGVPVGDPADFGRVVAFLCSEPAGLVSGTAVLVDGARTFALG